MLPVRPNTFPPRRAPDLLDGVLGYRRYAGGRADRSARPILWREGTSVLRDYRPAADRAVDATAPRLLVVPSLVNRYYILDLEPESRTEEHTSVLQSLMRISYADFCMKKKK